MHAPFPLQRVWLFTSLLNHHTDILTTHVQLGESDKAMMHTNWAMDLDPKASNNAMAKDTMDDYGAPTLPEDMASTPPPDHAM